MALPGVAAPAAGDPHRGLNFARERTLRRKTLWLRASLVIVLALMAGHYLVDDVVHQDLATWRLVLRSLALAAAVVALLIARYGPPRRRSRGQGATVLATSVLKAVDVPAVACWRDGSVHQVNDAFRNRVGSRLRGHTGRPLTDFLADAPPPSANRLLAASQVSERDMDLATGRFSSSPALLSAASLGHEDGEALGSVVFFREPKSGGRRPSSDESVISMRDALFGSTMALTVIDLSDNRVLAANDEFLDLTGYLAADVMEMEALEIGLWPRPADWHRILRALRGEESGEAVPVEVKTAAGRIRETEVYARRVRHDGSNVALLAMRDVTELREAERRSPDRSLYDKLTGLPNRVLFMDRVGYALERTRRYGQRVAVLLIDLDGLSMVNATYGQAVGDEILGGVAWRLYRCFRGMDTVCRHGSDEFAVLLENVDDAEAACAAADRFRRYLKDPFEARGERLGMEAAIGVALSIPGQTEPEDLIRWADAAMYRAKRSGEPTPLHVFDPERDSGDVERLSRANELRRALEREELSLVWQPMVWLGDSRIVGAEALIRWEHPERGRLTPMEFIPLAEETGLITDLGHWVMRRACEHAVRWRQSVPGFKVSVNLSPYELRQPELVDRTRDILQEFGLPPEALQMEMTETVAVRESRRLEQLRELGVRVAIDDFGTGYSSLEYLRGLEIDVIKIDKVFVDDLGTDATDTRGRAVVEAVLLMAEAFDLEVVAEGVETSRQADVLRQIGCTLGQGYHYARPQDADELEAMLSRAVPVTGEPVTSGATSTGTAAGGSAPASAAEAWESGQPAESGERPGSAERAESGSETETRSTDEVTPGGWRPAAGGES